MLVFKRRRGESVIINGDTLVEIIDIGSNHVRIGIDAPHDIDVDRVEVHRRKHAERLVAEADGSADMDDSAE